MADRSDKFKHNCINICTWNNGMYYKKNCDMLTQDCHYDDIRFVWCSCKAGFAQRNPEDKDSPCEEIPEDVCATQSCSFSEKGYPDPDNVFNCLCRDPCSIPEENTCDPELEICSYSNIFGSDNVDVTCSCKNPDHKQINGKCTSATAIDVCANVNCPGNTKCYRNDKNQFTHECLDPCKIDSENTCDPVSQTCMYNKFLDSIDCSCNLKNGYEMHNGKCEIPPADVCATLNCSDTEKCYKIDKFTAKCQNPCVEEDLCSGINEVCSYSNANQQHTCSCAENHIRNPTTNNCELPPSDPCASLSCAANEKCYTLSQFSAKCANPCVEENLCTGVNEICNFLNNSHTCNCAENHIRNPATNNCELPKADICQDVSCPNADEKCYPDPNNRFNHLCQKACEIENICRADQICRYQNSQMTCSCSTGQQERNNSCQSPPDNVCETNPCLMKGENFKCYPDENDQFSHQCLDPCVQENLCNDVNEICKYSSFTDTHTCNCRGRMERVDGICRLPPDDPCLGVTCSFNDNCYPNPENNFGHICQNPCDRDNPCGPDEICSVAEDPNSINVKFYLPVCNCPPGQEKYQGECQKIPENVCSNASCPSDRICQPSLTNKFEFNCIDTCKDSSGHQLDGVCQNLGEICSIQNHTKTCKCPSDNMKIINNQCTSPPANVCFDESVCKNNLKCYPDDTDPYGWEFKCEDPCQTENTCSELEICSYSNPDFIADKGVTCSCPEGMSRGSKNGKITCIQDAKPNTAENLIDQSNFFKSTAFKIILIVAGLIIVAGIIGIIIWKSKQSKGDLDGYRNSEGDEEYQTLKKQTQKENHNHLSYNQYPNNNYQYSTPTPTDATTHYEPIIPNETMPLHNMSGQSELEQAADRFAGEFSDEDD